MTNRHSQRGFAGLVLAVLFLLLLAVPLLYFQSDLISAQRARDGAIKKMLNKPAPPPPAPVQQPTEDEPPR